MPPTVTLSVNIMNTTSYNILPVTLDWQAGGTTSVISSNNGIVQTYNFTGDGQGDEPGLVVIYILSESTYVWSFLIFFENSPNDFACYGYWGWPKELSDCVNWLTSSEAQKYYTNQGPYTFGPPASSADGAWVTMNITTASPGSETQVGIVFNNVLS